MVDKKSSLGSELILGVTYASLMSAVSLFFVGILISQYRTFDASIKVPVIFLIISTFSFIFSATVYSNAGNEITLNKFETVERHLVYAKNIVEVLGLYLFVLATPLVIGAVTGDGFLRTSIIVVALASFVLYSQSRFSTLEKEASRIEKRLISATIFFIALVIYATQSGHSHNASFVYSAVSVVLILFLIALTAIFCTNSKQYVPIEIRPYDHDDVEPLSKIIRENLHRVKDQVDHKISSPETIKKLTKDNDVFVAEFSGKVVGMVCISSNNLSHIFTDHTVHRKGVGRTLVHYAEDRATEGGFTELKVRAVASEYPFYKRLGFRETGTSDDGRVPMLKKL